MKNNIYKNFSSCVGNTPLLRLNKVSEITGCNIYGKCEFLNPGGSVKDRTALKIIDDAIKNKLIAVGGTIVEGTAGNTGIGLTLLGNSLGLKTIIVMPETQSEEKKIMLKLCGAKLKLVKAVPYSNPKNYVKFSKTVAQNTKNNNGVFWANQFDNLSNYLAHYENTGPEIWKQLYGNIDAFICAIGTGGTIAGVSNFLKEKNKNINISIADPSGSAMHNFYKNNVLKSSGSSITEGIGQGRITKNLEKLIVDDSFQIKDSDALKIVFDLVKEEGLILGGSSGINIAGAMQLAKKMGPGKTIVTILCDNGSRYQSKIFNKNFLKEKNLPYPDWM